MDMQFVNSPVWQVIAFTETLLSYVLSMYFIANLAIRLANEVASVKRKLLFALMLGAGLQFALPMIVFSVSAEFWAFPKDIIFTIVYFTGSGYLYYKLGSWFLKLSPIRSIKLMGYTFAYYVFTLNLLRLLTGLWPVYNVPSANFLMSVRNGINLLILISLYCVTDYVIRRVKPTITIEDKIFVDLKKEILVYMAKVVFFCFSYVCLPLFISSQITVSIIALLLMVIFFAFCIVFDLYTAVKSDSANQKVHISLLTKGINEVRAVRHDLNNILQTYGGYIELGDIDRLKKYHLSMTNMVIKTESAFDLSGRMEENPAFITLLESKAEYAKNSGVQISMSLQCSTENLYIDNLEICRCVACLLDNAIEASVASAQKNVSFTLEQKAGSSKLIIITNSVAEPIDIEKSFTAGVTSKRGHQGLGLSNVNEILGVHGNCTFNMTCYNGEVSAYIELRQK